MRNYNRIWLSWTGHAGRASLLVDILRRKVSWSAPPHWNQTHSSLKFPNLITTHHRSFQFHTNTFTTGIRLKEHSYSQILRTDLNHLKTMELLTSSFDLSIHASRGSYLDLRTVALGMRKDKAEMQLQGHEMDKRGESGRNVAPNRQIRRATPFQLQIGMTLEERLQCVLATSDNRSDRKRKCC
ncbi:hypothetical protein PROFUN_07118 [Planoprotostelium fungivorum]|uniref:Uncharacterized protein n=1 Tax=Planoprotostelium fungivorum TaxID=1890364 RepID=A0A2P6NMH8_9EUKA|nr:hypothetical protein PROFUN_07118 [Planoprotostelium fungivorum]